MAKVDKDYVDSLNSIANKRMDGIENRIAIIESHSGVPAVPTEVQSDPASVPTISLDDLREMITIQVTLCLKQHQEQIQAEEAALKKKRDEEYEQEIAEKRRVAEAAGRRYIASAPEWFALIHQTQKTHNKRTQDTVKSITRIMEIFNNSLNNIQKTTDNILEHVTPPSPPIEPKPASIFANLPSGLRAKIKALRNRIKERLRTYLKGSYSFNRGWSLLVIMLYGLLMVFFAIFKISISV